MLKSGTGNAPRTHRRRRAAELPNAVEGQIGELCYELAVQVKRLRQLQNQAEELRTVIGAWAVDSESDPEPVHRERRH